jgi:hypothetical protein
VTARRGERTQPAAADLAATFDALCAVLQPLARTMRVSANGPGLYTLLTQPTPKHPDGVPFASVSKGKNYVSFHFMPIYGCADLQASLSPELRARMQGKACFNWSAPPTPELRRELTALVRAGRDRFRKLRLP